MLSNFFDIHTVVVVVFFLSEKVTLVRMLLKRGMGSGEWGMGNGEWGMGNGEWGMGNGEWGMGNEK